MPAAVEDTCHCWTRWCRWRPTGSPLWADDERGGVRHRRRTACRRRAGDGGLRVRPDAMLESVRAGPRQDANAPLHYERFSPPPVVDGIPFKLELARSQRSAQSSCEPVGARRHARRRSDDRALVPARLLRDLQGESARRRGRLTAAAARGTTARCWCVSRGRRRPAGDRRVSTSAKFARSEANAAGCSNAAKSATAILNRAADQVVSGLLAQGARCLQQLVGVDGVSGGNIDAAGPLTARAGAGAR